MVQNYQLAYALNALLSPLVEGLLDQRKCSDVSPL